jgi:hypothetical protein
MTVEQILTLRDRVLPICNAVPYGSVTLQDGAWVVGFRENKAIMALQIEFRDREIANDADLYRAEIDLENQIRGAIMLSA